MHIKGRLKKSNPKVGTQLKWHAKWCVMWGVIRHGILIIIYTSKFCKFCHTQPFLTILNVNCGNILKFHTKCIKFTQALLACLCIIPCLGVMWCDVLCDVLFNVSCNVSCDMLCDVPCNMSCEKFWTLYLRNYYQDFFHDFG